MNDMKKLFSKVLNIVQIYFIMIFCVAIFILSSCANEQLSPSGKIAVKGSTDVIPSYDFNWETADLMPTPSNSQIYVPWFYGAASSICSTYPADVYSDYKKADGWVMLYNGFSPTTIVTSANSFFILYNKYKGLMRIYQYNPVGGLTCSSTISSGISWSGNGFGNNSTLSFLGRDIVDLAKTQTSYYALEPGPQNNIESPVHPDKWYMFQYELAYDPNLTYTTSQTPPTLTWFVNYTNITSVKLSGGISGTINGTIGSSTLNNDISSSLVSGGKDLGTAGIAALGTSFFSTNKLGLPSSIYDKIKDGVSSALSAATGNLPGAITNILSAIFTGSSASTPQTLKLDLSATLHLEGTQTNNGSLFSGNTIPFPGTLATTDGGSYYYTSGFSPIYNQSLGVFNLSNKPTVIKKTTISNQPKPGKGAQYSNLYSIDNNSFQIQWNSALTSIATITNLTKEIIISPEYNFTVKGHGGRVESYNGNSIFTGIGGISDYYYTLDDSSEPRETVYIRISFNVVPNDGAPTSTIVKTFAVNVNQTVVDQFVCPDCPK